MLSIQQCREIIGNSAITDKELEQLRNSLYSIADLIIKHTVGEDAEENSNHN